MTGVAVSMAGNMHYVIYAWIWPRLADLGIVSERDDYWFPDATRYIGHDPETADKTIHEFPSYSFVLGDLPCAHGESNLRDLDSGNTLRLDETEEKAG